jgi:exopolysaccharide production protein ExoQ
MPTKLFVLLVLLLSSGALLPLLRPGDENTEGNDPVIQALFAGIYVVTLLLILLRWKVVAYVATRDKLLLALVGVALISVLWSVTPEVTLRRGIALVGTTLFGAYLATRYSLREQLRLVAWVMGIAALLSLLVSLGLPSFGISSEPGTAGDWKGIFSHKNTLGRNMSLGALVFLLLALWMPRHRWLMWFSFGLSLVLILLANSMTALAVLLILVIFIPISRALRLHYALQVPVLVAVILLGGSIIIWLFNYPEVPLWAIGRDENLTGRTIIWDGALEMIWERSWLGYGYGAFWQGWEGESARLFIYLKGLGIPLREAGISQAHNDVLDLMLNLGVLGLFLFCTGFFRAFLRAISWSRSTITAKGFGLPEVLWPLLFLMFVLLSGLTERLVLQTNNLFWILYVSTLLSLARERVRTNSADTRNMRYRSSYPRRRQGRLQSNPSRR